MSGSANKTNRKTHNFSFNEGLAVRGTAGSFFSKKNYIINTFHFIRILNPM